MKRHRLMLTALSLISVLAVTGCARQQAAPSGSASDGAAETNAAAEVSAPPETETAVETADAPAAQSDSQTSAGGGTSSAGGNGAPDAFAAAGGNGVQEAFAVENAKLETETAVSGDLTVRAALGEGNVKSVTYDALDLEPVYDSSAALDIRFDGDKVDVESSDARVVRVDGGTVTLAAGGIYRLRGKLDAGHLRLEGGKKDRTLLVLDGVNITSIDTPVIYAPDGVRVLIRLGEGSMNVLRDGGDYAIAPDGDDPDAVIYSKGSVSFTGGGSLKISAKNGSGIHSKDVLTLLSGTYLINADKNALKGKDAVIVRGGEYHFFTGNDAVKSTNKKDEDAGFIWIEDGFLDVNSGDKGISAQNALVIAGGSVRVNAVAEALEGKTVDILGGRLDLKAGDDGINASSDYETHEQKKNYQKGVYIRLAGGVTTIDAPADGIDSNGNLYLDGGALYLSGPSDDYNAILDYSGSAKLTGGTVIASGSSGMLQDLGGDTEQNYLIVHFESAKAGGTKLSVLDEAGKELGAFTPARSYTAAIITMKGLEAGARCTVTAGDEKIEARIMEGASIY